MFVFCVYLIRRCAYWCVLLLILACAHHASSISQLSDTHGIIQSTNYPLPYPDNLNVRWEINVKAGHRVKLYFIEFDLEPGTKGCNADYVLVRFDYCCQTLMYCGWMLKPFSHVSNLARVPC